MTNPLKKYSKKKKKKTAWNLNIAAPGKGVYVVIHVANPSRLESKNGMGLGAREEREEKSELIWWIFCFCFEKERE